ncbi:MAG: NAD(P)-dependent oxidoreductase [Gammaproteobacteria bacterium]
MNAPAAGPVALVGAGRMGRGVGRNLLAKGHGVIAFDVDPKAVATMRELGAASADSPAAAARQADVVITCLPDLASVAAVYDGADGLVAQARPGALFIEMTSSSPRLARDIGARAAARGIGMVDAPMLRGAKEAWDGTVHVLLAGTVADRERARPILALVSERIIEVGALGDAHALKAINNSVSMANCVVIGEAFQAAARLGFAPALVAEVLSGGLGTSRMLELYAPRLVSGEHPRTGSIAFGAKDLGIFLEIAAAGGAFTPVAEAAHEVYRRLCEGGAGGDPPSRLADLMGALAAPDPDAG